jgi:hypothetical protein
MDAAEELKLTYKFECVTPRVTNFLIFVISILIMH